MGNRWGNSGNSVRLYFWGLQNHCRWWLQPWNLKTLAPWKESYDQPREHIQKQRHYFANKGPSSQGYGFSSGHVQLSELDCEESWVLKNWCFWTVVLEKTLESPLDCKETQPVHPKGDQSWVFIGRKERRPQQASCFPNQRCHILMPSAIHSSLSLSVIKGWQLHQRRLLGWFLLIPYNSFIMGFLFIFYWSVVYSLLY